MDAQGRQPSLLLEAFHVLQASKDGGPTSSGDDLLNGPPNKKALLRFSVQAHKSQSITGASPLFNKGRFMHTK